MPSSREPRSGSGAGDTYPSWIGLIFLFNLIVGTGALTLPAAFAKTGWLLGLILIIILAFISYMTVTFVVEVMACANAITHWNRMEHWKRERDADNNVSGDMDSNGEDETQSSGIDDYDNEREPHGDQMNAAVEHVPLFSQRTRYYQIETKVELVDMARLFFNDIGRVLFFLCFAIYLYGDLSIYSAAISQTLRDVICTRNVSFGNRTDDELDMELCWMNASPGPFSDMTRLDCYRLSLIGFAVVMVPFAFFNVQKTKYIQMCTVMLRWMAFSIMITIAIQRLMTEGRQGFPPAANLYGIPSMFGACVYSFMCHHSLPSIVAPIQDKMYLHAKLSADYVMIGGFYLCLALTGAFAFAHLEDLYTLNFIPGIDERQTEKMLFIEYFLALFPVFTLTASFPIIAITLRNNLEALFIGSTNTAFQQSDVAYTSLGQFLLRKCAFPLMAVLPPIVITFFTDSLAGLVSFTGSYAGTGIQYIIPIALVWQARKVCRTALGQGIVNEHRSPFQSIGWLIFVLVWSVACVVFVSANFLTNTFQHMHRLGSGIIASDFYLPKGTD